MRPAGNPRAGGPPVPRQTPHLVRAGLIVCALGCSARPTLADGTSAMNTGGLTMPDLGELASRRHLAYALAGGTAAWLAYQHEDHSRVEFAATQDRSPLDAGIDLGNTYGHGATLAAGTAGLWTMGHLTGNPNTVGAASDLAKGLVLDAALVYALKAGLDRTGNGQGYSSASAHTASAFTVAPILTSRFGWKVGVPAYGLAAVTAFGRIEDNKQFPSGVIAGATLGFIVGESVAHHGAKLRMPGHLTMGRKGVGLRFKF